MADLTPEQIRLEQERLDLIQRQNQAAKELASTYEKMAKSKTKLTQDEKELLGLTKQLSDISATIESSVNKRLSGSASIKDLEKTINNLKNDQVRMDNALRDYAQKTSDLKQKALEAARKAAREENQQKNLLKNANLEELRILDEIDALKRSGNNAQDIADKRRELLLQRDIIKAHQDKLNKSTKTKDEQKELVKQLDASLKAHEKIKSEQQKELELAEQALAQAKKKAILDALGEQFRVKEIAQMFTMVGLMKMIVDAAFKADEQTTELAKSLGIGKDQAREIRQEFVKYSNASNDSFVTTTKLLEAQSQLSEQLGVSVVYSGKQTEDFSRLTKLMGLSTEQAGKLAKLSIINGKSIEDTTKSIIRGSAASQQSNKLSVDQRTILKDVANLSEGILIKFQGNPEALGAAVVQARKLGLTLSEVDKIGESLLNWESSIENELKAELITGRQLNFERARAAALTGDQATLMKEIASQTGSLADFQNMNVIAQKSLAEAFGLSRDEMSKMLLEQEKINKLGDVSQMTLDEQLKALKAQGEPLDSALYKQIQQQSAQEKFNNAIEKLQDILGNLVAGPLGRLIEGFANLASHSWAIYTVMGLLGAISLTKTIGSLALMGAELVAAGVASATLVSALSFGLGIAAVVAGIATIVGMMNSSTDEATSKVQRTQDGIAPAGNGPFTITDGFGRTAITAKGDGLAVSPNINRGGGDAGIIAAIEKLAARPAVAYINGKEAFAKDLGSANALSTSQMQNTSYRLA